METLTVPRPLKQGETIGIVAPSGPMQDLSNLEKITALLQSWGFRVKIAPSCWERCSDYLAGSSDEARAWDVMDMFENPEIGAVLCMRGGYGSNRLLPFFDDFDFGRYPKPFIGYSDITYLHVFLNQKHGLMTFHGPMVKELLKGDDLTEASFRLAVSGKNDYILQDIPYFGGNRLAGGQLVGGNLTMICTTLGTDNEIDTAGKILFLEDVDEPLYSIDRLVMHLRNAGKLQQVKGIILGNFNVEDWVACYRLLRKMLEPLGVPVAHHVDSGHCQPLLTLPLGAWATLNPRGKQIIITSGTCCES